MVNDKKGGNHKLLNSFKMVCTPFALQGCDPGSKTLFSIVLMQVCFSLDNQEEYTVNVKNLKEKKEIPWSEAGVKLMTFLIYQPQCYDFTKFTRFKFNFGWGIAIFTPFFPDYDIQQYSLSTNCCTKTIIQKTKNQSWFLNVRRRSIIKHNTFQVTNGPVNDSTKRKFR